MELLRVHPARHPRRRVQGQRPFRDPFPPPEHARPRDPALPVLHRPPGSQLEVQPGHPLLHGRSARTAADHRFEGAPDRVQGRQADQPDPRGQGHPAGDLADHLCRRRRDRKHRRRSRTGLPHPQEPEAPDPDRRQAHDGHRPRIAGGGRPDLRLDRREPEDGTEQGRIRDPFAKGQDPFDHRGQG